MPALAKRPASREGHRPRRRHGSDGLPDLLLVAAVAAYRLGDHARSAVLLHAIRSAGRPTHNFLDTILYRQLRRRVEPGEPTSIGGGLSAVLDDAREWLATLET